MNIEIHLTYSPARIIATLIGIELSLLFLDLTVYYFELVSTRQLRDLIDISLEANLPTWFSSTQAFFTGLLAWFIAKYHKINNDSKRRWAWLMIAIFFMYMGIDDASSFHEAVGHLAAGIARNQGDTLFVRFLTIAGSYYWHMIFIPIFAVFGIFMVVFFNREFKERKLMLLFLTGMACYVLALGLDYYDGLYNYDLIINNTVLTFEGAQHLFRAVEEFIEMFGTTMIFGSFIFYWDRQA